MASRPVRSGSNCACGGQRPISRRHHGRRASASSAFAMSNIDRSSVMILSAASTSACRTASAAASSAMAASRFPSASPSARAAATRAATTQRVDVKGRHIVGQLPNGNSQLGAEAVEFLLVAVGRLSGCSAGSQTFQRPSLPIRALSLPRLIALRMAVWALAQPAGGDRHRNRLALLADRHIPMPAGRQLLLIGGHLAGSSGWPTVNTCRPTGKTAAGTGLPRGPGSADLAPAAAGPYVLPWAASYLPTTPTP